MGEDRGPEIRLDLESVTQVDLLVGLTCVTPRGPQHILRIHSPNTGVFRHHPHTYALVRQWSDKALSTRSRASTENKVYITAL